MCSPKGDSTPNVARMELLLYLSSGVIGALLTLAAGGFYEHIKRKREIHAIERHAVASLLGRVAEVQHRIELLSTNPATNAYEALPAFERLHGARMAFLTEYARTRLDVTTPSVRNAIDRVAGIMARADQINNDGAAGEPYQISVRRLIVLNSQLSTSCEDLLQTCEAEIGPTRLSRRERKRAISQPAPRPAQSKGDGEMGA